MSRIPIVVFKRLRALMFRILPRNIYLFVGIQLCGIATVQSEEPTSNPYVYLDEYSSSYYPGTTFPKLITQQWVGEANVQAVVTLGIDDMRDTGKYEAYLRPLLDRLKKIDGRAPVSIMTCNVDPNDPQLQSWLKEGLSLETHTVAHPCPCLQGGDFAKAKATYDKCVDMMFAVPNSSPVAFRFPCMDSKNTPSPRAFAEIINKTSDAGNFLQASTSVVCVFKSNDPEIPNSITQNPDGSERFERYIPFPSFVNKIENYPYPYVIGKLCWEFPCTIPDDWQAQNIQQPNNPRTVDDLVVAIDATVVKRGIANIIFHPHNWIRNDQMATVVDRVQKKHGEKVKFLTFRECIDRINKNLLLGQPLRAEDGGDNGVRLMDLNKDGFLDVLIGNEKLRVARVWQPTSNQWLDIRHDIQFTAASADARLDLGVKVGELPSEDSSMTAPTFLVNNEREKAMYQFRDNQFVRKPIPKSLLSTKTSNKGVDQGVRLRDVDGDGVSELLIGNPNQKEIWKLDNGAWKKIAALPAAIVDDQGRDNGVRFVDLNGDKRDDLIVSNPHKQEVHLRNQSQQGFVRSRAEIENGIPLIVRDGTNNGAWFAANHLWLQNEDTHRLPDGVDRRSFNQLIGRDDPAPLSPTDSLKSIEVRDGFKVELVAAEPLVMDPVAIDWGPDGKLWVVEMADYPLGLDDKGKPGGRVRYLEDSNGDGKYDKSTLFLDGVAYPTGVIAWRDGVIVSAAPTVFFAADRDGDGKAEYREDLYRGFTEGNQQHLVNGFERGLDNWLYLANGDSGGTVKSLKTGKEINLRGYDLRIRPEDGSLDPQSGRTQFGRHRDDHGNWFGCSNPLPLRHYVLADHYLRRNPHVASPSARRDVATVGNTQLFPISRVLSHWSGYKPPAPGTGHKFTSACSTMVYRDELCGDRFVNNTFTCEPVHNAVHRRQLIPNGILFDSSRPDDEAKREFLASKDSWFRPATVTTGPDGAIWICDMYRLVIEHPEWIDDQEEKELFLRAGHDRGRIYRVYPADKSPRRIPKLATLNDRELVRQLTSPNGRVRDLAQAMLIEKGDPKCSSLVSDILQSSENPIGRLHALCTLDGMNALKVNQLVAAISDPHPTVRRHAIRISERFISGASQNASEDIDRILKAIEKCDKSDPHVQLQLAYSLGESKSKVATQVLADIAIATHANSHLRAAVISSLNEHNLAGFHQSIGRSSVGFDAYRDTLTQMAIRTRNSDLISQQVESLLASAEATRQDFTKMKRLASLLGALRTHGVSLEADSQTRVRKIIASASELANDSNQAEANRVAAINFLASSGGHSDSLLSLIEVTQPTVVQTAAAKILAKRPQNELIKKIVTLSPSVRTEILNELLRRESSSLQLVNAIKTGDLPVNEIGMAHRQSLQGHASDKVRTAAKELFGATSGGNKSEVMERYADSSPLDGDPKLGQAVFTKHCSACHQVKGVGHIVGPDLAAVKNRSAKAMLTAILDPNAAVEDKFRSYSVLTLDGEAFTGMIASEAGSSITLKMQNNKSVTILRDDIDIIKSTGVSLMPEELEKLVSPNDMNHLLAFLNELGPAPRSFDGNTPKTIAPSKDGSVALLATHCRIYGDKIVFEPKYKNIGYWSSAEDHIEWTFAVDRPGKYTVWLDYACPDHTSGNRYRFSCGTQTLTGKIDGTGTWDDYRQVQLGTIQLGSTATIGSFRSEGEIRKNLLDLRSITLKPSN